MENGDNGDRMGMARGGVSRRGLLMLTEAVARHVVIPFLHEPYRNPATLAA